jgi:hypothetical protein
MGTGPRPLVRMRDRQAGLSVQNARDKSHVQLGGLIIHGFQGYLLVGFLNPQIPV